MPGKEPMTAENFDEDDYASNLIDKEGYSETTARMMAKKKKESFEAKKIEIDLGSLAKSKKRVWVKPTATKKGFYREQEVGRKTDPKSKEPWKIPVGKFVMNYVQSKGDEIGRIVSDDEVRRVRLNYQQEGATIHAKAMKAAVSSGKKIPKKI